MEDMEVSDDITEELIGRIDENLYLKFVNKHMMKMYSILSSINKN